MHEKSGCFDIVSSNPAAPHNFSDSSFYTANPLQPSYLETDDLHQGKYRGLKSRHFLTECFTFLNLLHTLYIVACRWVRDGGQFVCAIRILTRGTSTKAWRTSPVQSAPNERFCHDFLFDVAVVDFYSRFRLVPRGTTPTSMAESREDFRCDCQWRSKIKVPLVPQNHQRGLNLVLARASASECRRSPKLDQ